MDGQHLGSAHAVSHRAMKSADQDIIVRGPFDFSGIRALARAVNALQKMRVIGGQFFHSDVSCLLKVSGGGSGQMNFRGEYDNTATYVAQDVVVISSGAGTGTYVCVQDAPAGTSP